MRSFLVATIAAVASCALVVAQIPPAPTEVVWEGMYAPPYLANPQIAMAMSCLSDSQCYIAGGSNGQGFGIFTYDGKMNGAVVGPMNEPNMSLMVTDIAIGGTAANPKGAFSSVDMLGMSVALQYLTNNGQEWLPSAWPNELIYIAAAITGTKGGNNVVAVGDGPISGPSLMISNDGGASFRAQPLTWKAPENCSAAGSISMPSPNAWYMSWGNQPPQKKGSGSSSTSGSSSSFAGPGPQSQLPEAGVDAKYLQPHEVLVARKLNGQVLVTKNMKTGAVRSHVKTPVQFYEDLKTLERESDSSCNYFVGYILKSTDQGQTWRKVYDNKMATIGNIVCHDDTACIATAWNAGESYTISMVDGHSFKITYTTPPASATQAETVGAAAYRSATEVWVGGSAQTQSSGKGMFWSSTDGGATWTKYKHSIPDIVAIMAMDFTQGVGFALGMTMFKTSQIMRYKKQADYGSWIQKQCPVAGCTFLCQDLTFPQGMCLSTQGGSAKVFCQNGGVEQYIYQTTSCVGSYQKTLQPVNVCLNGTQNFFENICPTGATGPLSSLKAARRASSKDKFLH